MEKIIWLLRKWLEWKLYHAAHRLNELSWRLSQKPPNMKKDGLLYIHSPIHELKYHWREVLASAPAETRKSPAVAILMSAGIEPVAVKGDMIVLTARYPVHKAIMEQPANQYVADQIMSNFFGQPMHVNWSQGIN